MPNYLTHITREPKLHIKTFIEDYKYNKDKDYFKPHGVQVYCGRQGKGKTISAVKNVHDLKHTYPKSIIVTNLALTTLKQVYPKNHQELKTAVRHIQTTKQYLFFQTTEELIEVLKYVNNGKFGVIYLIDEIHLYFNSVGSLNVPMSIFSEIAQQRKQRKIIIGTSQLFTRLAKPFREQCDNIIMCNTILGKLTIQAVYDGSTLDEDNKGKLTGTKRKTGFFWHSPELRNAFDTYQKVVSYEESFEPIQNTPIVIDQNPKKRIRIGG